MLVHRDEHVLGQPVHERERKEPDQDPKGDACLGKVLRPTQNRDDGVREGADQDGDGEGRGQEQLQRQPVGTEQGIGCLFRESGEHRKEGDGDRGGDEEEPVQNLVGRAVPSDLQVPP